MNGKDKLYPQLIEIN